MPKFAILPIALLLLPALATAADPSSLQWSIDGAETRFLRYEDARLTVSAGCLQKGGYLKCDAMKAVTSVKDTGLTESNTRGGRNPGSVLCRQAGGFVVFGKSKAGESTFCRFKDGSMVENGSLYASAIRNSGGGK